MADLASGGGGRGCLSLQASFFHKLKAETMTRNIGVLGFLLVMTLVRPADKAEGGLVQVPQIDTAYSVGYINGLANSSLGQGVWFDWLLSDSLVGFDNLYVAPATPGAYPRGGVSHTAAKAGENLDSVLGTYAYMGQLQTGPSSGTSETTSVAYWRDYLNVPTDVYGASIRMNFELHGSLSASAFSDARVRLWASQNTRTTTDSSTDPGASNYYANIGNSGGIVVGYGLYGSRTPEWQVLTARSGILFVDLVSRIPKDDGTEGGFVLEMHMDVLPVRFGYYTFEFGLVSEVESDYLHGGWAESNIFSTLSFTGATNTLTGDSIAVTFGSGTTNAPTKGPVVPEPTSLALAGFTGLGIAVGALRRRRKQPSNTAV